MYQHIYVSRRYNILVFYPSMLLNTTDISLFIRMCVCVVVLMREIRKFNLNSDHEEKKTYFHMSSKVLVTTAIKLTMHNFHYYPAEIYVYIRVYRWVYVLIGALRNNKYHSCTFVSACRNIDIQCLTTMLNKVKLAFHLYFFTFLRRTCPSIFCAKVYIFALFFIVWLRT